MSVVGRALGDASRGLEFRVQGSSCIQLRTCFIALVKGQQKKKAQKAEQPARP